MFYTNVYQNGNTILQRYIADDGEDRVTSCNFSPTLFKHSSSGNEEFVDIYGRPCVPVRHDNIGAARKWMKDMRDINREPLGMDNFLFSYLHESWPVGSMNPIYEKLDIGYFDIEVPTRDGFPKPEICRWEIDSICIYSTKTKKYNLFTIREWDKAKSVLWKDDDGKPSNVPDHVVYKKCASEKEVLVSFLRYIKENPPHILTGWNVDLFDIPYLVGRIKRVLGDKFVTKLSPFGIVDETVVIEGEGDDAVEMTTYQIRGIDVIDYLPAYKKFTFKTRPTYKLDYIGEVEVGMKKIDIPFKTYLDFAEGDPQVYSDYLIRDVQLVKRIDERLSLLHLITSIAWYARVGFMDVFSPLKTWDAIIHNSLYQQGIVVPENKSARKDKYAGAFVKSPIPNLYRWILSFDLTSLYPHIIMGWNISPETIVDQMNIPKCLVNDRVQPDIDSIGLVAGTYPVPSGDNTFAANGMMYRRDVRGVIPTEIEKVFLQRKSAKTAEFRADKVATNAGNELTSRRDEGRSISGKQTLERYQDIPDDEILKLNDEDLEFLVAAARRQEKLENVNQQARKVLINSLYGALGNQHFRYFDLRNAEAITMSGQLAIKWIMRKINEYMNTLCQTDGVDYCVYGDTDSVYVTFERFVEMTAEKKGVSVDDIEKIRWVDFLDKFAKSKVEPYIDTCYRELAKYVNMYDHKLFMDREIIADTAFWTAKKRYAANVWDSEGKRKYDDHGNVVPKLKIMGIETQRSSTPPYAAKMLEKSIKTILTGGESGLQTLVATVKSEYPTKPYSELASVSSANNMDKNHVNFVPVSGCPFHIKAAIAYNKAVHMYGGDAILPGDKIQMVMLRVPNKLGAPVLAFPSGGKIPEEFPVTERDIDYLGMYEKHFLSPLTKICESIGWVPEKKTTLDDLFGDW